MNQSRSRGSVNLSVPRLNYNTEDTCTVSSSTTIEHTSEYFLNKKTEEGNVTTVSHTSESFASPYKNSLRQIRHRSPDNENCDDFRSPIARKKPQKIVGNQKKSGTAVNKQNKKKQARCSTINRKSYKNTLSQTIKDNFLETDVNAEHLQMALALSKSTYIAENLETCKEVEGDDLASFLTVDEIPNVKTTLERFGFMSDRKWEPVEVPKKNKHSRFRYVTPILHTRTSEEREEMIVSKIASILSLPSRRVDRSSKKLKIKNELCSDLLNKYHDANSVFYTVNNLNLEEANTYDFYNKHLNLARGNSRAGCLLKNWADLPGRDKTPERRKLSTPEQRENYNSIISNYLKGSNVTDVNLETINLTNKASERSALNVHSKEFYNSPKVVTEKRSSVSPDMFGSESETEYSRKSSDRENLLSQSLLCLTPTKCKSSQLSNLRSPQVSKKKIEISCEIFKTSTGIEHFESYSSDLKNFSEEVYDLTTQSSGDEDTEELYNNSFKKNHELVAYDLSTSDLSNASERGNKSIVKDGENVTEANCCEAFHTNFDMSPLQLKNSDEFQEDCKLKLNVENAEDTNFSINCSKQSPREMDYDCTKLLNVTDFVTRILNEEAEGGTVGDTSDNRIQNANERFDGDCRTFSSTADYREENVHESQGSCSQDSIVISDEELNYSSLYSKHAEYDHIRDNQFDNDHADQPKSDISQNNMLNYRKNEHLYSLLDTEKIQTDTVEMDVAQIENVHSVLKYKYRSLDITPVVHNRIRKLKEISLLKNQSLSNNLLEDSFNDVLQDPAILATIENEAGNNRTENQNDSSREASTTDKCLTDDNFVTPEKANTFNISSIKSESSVMTPDNNVIIKTKDITPMANYDEMNTPKVADELLKFGLKPLKRQRGVKLLKYLYECTHPLVDPIGILSSDEDDHRTIKKIKLSEEATEMKSIDLSLTQKDNGNICKDNIEIVGDELLERESLEDFVFERKYSVKIPSCRVPLQVVWFNFLSQNPEIRENILLYEPLQLEVIHAMLKQQSGCKFHVQDLLTFLDKKCITIRTAQAQGSRRKTKK